MKDLDYSLPVNWFLYLVHTLLFIGVLSDRYNGEKSLQMLFLATVSPCCLSQGSNSAGGLLVVLHLCSQTLLSKEK